MVESIVILCDRSPIGANAATEAIRLGSGFVALGEMLECKVVLLGDAVYLVNKQSAPASVGMDSFAEALEMADLSDLELYVLDSALSEAGMTKDDLVDYENLSVVSIGDVAQFVQGADTCFRY